MAKTAPHKEDIKAALRKRYGSIVAFEREKGLPLRSANDVLAGKSVTNTARAIAEALGTTTDVLFPGRFKSHNSDNSASEKLAERLNVLGGAS